MNYKNFLYALAVLGIFSSFATDVNAITRKATMPAPQIIAHRGGKMNWPENTLCAFAQNVKSGVGAIEMDVQVTKDGTVILYHPEDLSQWTSASGAIADKTAAEVLELDTTSKYKGPRDFQTACTPDQLKIPKFADALQQIPANIPIIVDMKSLPADKLVDALIKTIPEKEWPRLRFYSTDPAHTKLVHERKPDAMVFEDRATTLKRLMFANAAAPKCEQPGSAQWLAYELVRPLNVCDKTKLGETCVEQVPTTMWTPESIKCTRAMDVGVKIAFFGINTAEDYARARELGADAVLSDNPAALLKKK